MALLDPTATSVGDLITAALKECGAIGVGQAPTGEDTTDAWARLQWMLQQWERKRWLVYHLVTLNITSTGAQSYTVGPGGNIDTGLNSTRPAKLESAFLRQLTQSQPNQIDYPLELLQSMEDYNRIALKQLQSFPGFAFYDPAFPLGRLFAWPVPQPTIYGVFITVLEQLPTRFATLATNFVLPFEYYSAMLYNLALRLCPKYGLRASEDLKQLARDGLATVRGANTAIAALQMPGELARTGNYNIFSDRFY